MIIVFVLTYEFDPRDFYCEHDDKGLSQTGKQCDMITDAMALVLRQLYYSTNITIYRHVIILILFSMHWRENCKWPKDHQIQDDRPNRKLLIIGKACMIQRGCQFQLKIDIRI